MANKPEFSIGVGLAVMAMVGAIYVNATPAITDIRAAPADDGDVSAARKAAAWSSAGLTAAVSLIARDPTVFILGGAATIFFDFWTRHSNAVHPAISKVLPGPITPQTQEQMPQEFGYADDIPVMVG